MKRFSVVLPSIVVVAALGGMFGCASPGPVVLAGDFPHMHRALAHLRAARHELETAETIFRDREEAIEHVDRAIHQVEVGLTEHGADTGGADVGLAGGDDGRFPHMRHAREHLRAAREELESAEPIFSGHRDRAIESTDRAIGEIEEGIHAAER